jgi:hypothetical protein
VTPSGGRATAVLRVVRGQDPLGSKVGFTSTGNPEHRDRGGNKVDVAGRRPVGSPQRSQRRSFATARSTDDRGCGEQGTADCTNGRPNGGAGSTGGVLPSYPGPSAHEGLRVGRGHQAGPSRYR